MARCAHDRFMWLFAGNDGMRENAWVIAGFRAMPGWGVPPD
jgi:hypothetical protein